MKGWPLVLLALRLLIAGVFIYAALPKIIDPAGFASAIRHYRLIEGPLVLWIALFLPWLELVLAVGILLPALRRASSVMIAALLFLFICIHISASLRGINPECGCFGSNSDETSYLWLLLRNGGLLVATALIAADAFRWASAPGPSASQ